MERAKFTQQKTREIFPSSPHCLATEDQDLISSRMIFSAVNRDSDGSEPMSFAAMLRTGQCLDYLQGHWRLISANEQPLRLL